MKARSEKSRQTFSYFLDFNSQLSCEKHPYSSPTVGICPHCLNDRLMELLCSDCGERRAGAASCSCSEIPRNSCSNVDVFGSVGRLSFLIDNDVNIDHKQRSSLRRSSSSCVGVKKSSGFWRIKGLFMKRRDSKERAENLEFCEMGSFRSGDENSFKQFGHEARKSGFSENGFGLKSNGGCRNQMEFDRFCSVPNRSVFPIKERAVDERGFIELKLESSSYESKQEFCAGRSSRASDHGGVGFYRDENLEVGEIVASLRRNGISGNGDSCRITMNERGLKQGRSRNYKLWKWIFKNRDEN